MPHRTALLLTSPDLGWLGLAAALRTMDDVGLVGETPCPNRGRALAADHRPDVIFCPTWLGAGPSPRLLLDLQRGPCPKTRIAFFSRGICRDDVAAAAGLRFHAWCLWSEVAAAEVPYLLRAIVLTNARIATPTPTDMLLGWGRAGEDGDGSAWLPVPFSDRERAALALLAREGEEYLTVAGVAKRLEVQPSSVDTYIGRIAEKLGLPGGGRRAVLAAARRRGVLG